MIYLLLVFIAAILGSYGALYLKKASKKFKLTKDLIKGASLYGAALILIIIALKYGPLSVVYPFVSIQYIFVSLLSVKYLNEKMTRLKWVGILLILIGVIFINWR